MYDAKPYDRRVFDDVAKEFPIAISYFVGHLDADTGRLERGRMPSAHLSTTRSTNL